MSSFTALIKGGRGGTYDTKGVAYLLEGEAPRLGPGLLTLRHF